MRHNASFAIQASIGETEQLRLYFGPGRITASLGVLSFIDKDTHQHVVYVPSLDISGYGDSFSKAIQLLQYNIDDFCQYITSLTTLEAGRELKNLGWKKVSADDTYLHTRTTTEIAEESFNAEDNKIERLTLQAA